MTNFFQHDQKNVLKFCVSGATTFGKIVEKHILEFIDIMKTEKGVLVKQDQLVLDQHFISINVFNINFQNNKD